MPWFIFVMFCKVASEVIRERIALARKAKLASLCADCYFAHTQYGANGRMAISCTFGGGVRSMKLDVLYCTDYQGRNLPTRTRAIGFVHEIEPAE